MAENFARAKNLLLGAVDTVLSLANQERARGTASQDSGSSSQPSRWLTQEPCSSSHLLTQEPGNSSQLSRRLTQKRGNSSRSLTQSASIEEHKRLFGYRPSKGKRLLSGKKQCRGRRKGSSTWRNDCICLREKEQNWRPSSEERLSWRGWDWD